MLLLLSFQAIIVAVPGVQVNVVVVLGYHCDFSRNPGQCFDSFWVSLWLFQPIVLDPGVQIIVVPVVSYHYCYSRDPGCSKNTGYLSVCSRDSSCLSWCDPGSLGRCSRNPGSLSMCSRDPISRTRCSRDPDSEWVFQRSRLILLPVRLMLNIIE